MIRNPHKNEQNSKKLTEIYLEIFKYWLVYEIYILSWDVLLTHWISIATFPIDINLNTKTPFMDTLAIDTHISCIDKQNETLNWRGQGISLQLLFNWLRQESSKLSSVPHRNKQMTWWFETCHLTGEGHMTWNHDDQSHDKEWWRLDHDQT